MYNKLSVVFIFNILQIAQSTYSEVNRLTLDYANIPADQILLTFLYVVISPTFFSVAGIGC